MSTTTPPLPPGVIQFFDNVEPGLKDATYRIDVTQAVSAPDARVAPVSQTFVVQGPRFTIDPSDVHTVFPPNGATGQFAEVLPHIVLNKRLLAWERDVPGLSTDAPWVALLVFQEEELVRDDKGLTLQTLSVKELLAPVTNLRKPKITQVSGQEQTSTCQAITFDSPLFARVLAAARELPYLTHARQVNTGGMPMFGHKDEGWFSVVVANRFPKSGTPVAARSIAHLVSLEGFSDLLTGNAPQAPTEAQVQMVSLANWTFSTLPDPAQTFSGLAQNLAYDGTALRPADALRLRLPRPADVTAPVAVQQRLDDGFVALGWHAPSGEDGFAWYRGPLTPVAIAPPADTSFASADAAMIYDAATGVFDHRLATAWQAGRALALANEPVATALLRLRLDAHAVVEAHAAPTSADVHAQLAALFSGGAIHGLATASASGHLAAHTPERSMPMLQAPVFSLRTLVLTATVQMKIAAVADGSPDASTVTAWLGQQLLLQDVSFVHLVPDARMLPTESIRFFYLDPVWLDAMMDGVLSIGMTTSRDVAVQGALLAPLKQAAWHAAQALRAKQTGDPIPPPPTGPMAGFLLRSALASGWPGLRVTGTIGTAATPVPLLRLAHVGPGVLLALFNGVPDTVTLAAPQEGLEFGVDDTGDIEVRTLDHGKVTEGARLTIYRPKTPDAASPAMRAGGDRVLNIAGGPANATPPADLLGLLAQALEIARDDLHPAQFAVQMIKGPEQIRFSLTPTPRPTT